MARYLKKWICERGHENWAYEYKCSSCGGPKTKNCKRYTPDPLVEATDEQWALKGPGPNWYCNWCGCENPAYNKTNCGYCGGPIGEAETNVGKKRVRLADIRARTPQQAETYGTTMVDHGDAGWGIPEEIDETTVQSYSTGSISGMESVLSRLPQMRGDLGSGSRSSERLVKIVGVILMIIVLCFISYGVWYAFFDTESHYATVSGYYWSRTADLEEKQTLNKVDWRSDMPSDSYNESCNYIFKKWTEEADGTEEVDVPGTCYEDVQEYVCDDDGADGLECGWETTKKPYSCTVKETRTKYKDVQVHEDKCTYNVDRWIKIDSRTTEGSDHHPYYYSYGYDDFNRYRTKEHPGTYRTFFTSDTVDPFHKDYDLTSWSRLNDQPGQLCQIEVNRRNKVVGKPNCEILP